MGVFDLGLTPGGRLAPVYEFADGGQAAPPEDAQALQLREAFQKGTPQGLLCLAQSEAATLPVAAAYWRDFAGRYLTALCHIPETADAAVASLPPPDDLELLADGAPPMRGGEYLSAEVLRRLWIDLDDVVRVEAGAAGGGLSAWLKKLGSLWHRVGRVCFHLAENKRDPECPFAFLATYAPRLLDGRRVQYQPLGRALEEYAGDRNRAALVRLLAPVQRAAERLDWVKTLVDSGDVFHPLRWTPREAWRLLSDAAVLEESGLLVRVPDWWAKRAPRVQVSVSIGGRPKTALNAAALLDFHVSMVLDGETLSESEWRDLLGGDDGLVFLKGRWVEVDRRKLADALEHFKRVQRQADDGVSFLEGMRLLAGAPIEAGEAALFDTDAAAAWAEVKAGPWLQERLQALRHPESGAADLPGAQLRATLRPYQEAGVKWLRLLTELGLGACLADDMGLGKTIQVIALALLLKREGASVPSLVVAPASLLANWKAELERFAPSLVVRFAHPSQTDDGELQAAASDPAPLLRGADVVVTTYGMLLRQPWLTETAWTLAVLDEAQAIKNPAARQTRAVKKLRAKARVVLTGTPVENRLSDLWSIFDFLCPGLLGSASAFKLFVKRLDDRAAGRYAPLRRLVAPYILRRLKTDKSVIADLPEKTEVYAYCTLTKKQAALYEQAVRELARVLETVAGIERRGAVLAFLMRFKQICNHPDQWTGSGAYDPAASGKFARLREVAEEIASRQEKALVFTQFREMTEPLAGFLAGIFGRPGAVLHGATPVKRRQALVEAFQREDGPPFFVLSLKAGGTGLNLTAASHVIHFDRWWNPAVENQATDRAFRIGQRCNVLVHKFVCQGTVEQHIDELIRGKMKLAADLLEGGGAAALTEMSDRQILDLVRLDVHSLQED
ncbi:MAG: DEAD/DEAH box helicase [Planctomycetota bacterium]|nr:DEAD/DEAH box helicase [Planctomycetota bacterium]